MEHEVKGARPRGRPKKAWREIVEKDCQAGMENSMIFSKISKISDIFYFFDIFDIYPIFYIYIQYLFFVKI